MTLPPPVQPPATLAERAYAQVKQLIFDFVLLPGDRFSESDLAQRVHVSRTPLRQALQRLQREGFLQVFPQSGWQVSPLDFEVFDQLYDMRVLLECHAVARMCEMEERPTLRALADQWLGPRDEQTLNSIHMDQQDEAFHHALVLATGNLEMARVHADITDRIRIIRRLDFTQPHRVDATCDEHARILRAVTRRRTDEAQRLLKAHIEQSKLEVRRITLDMLYQVRQRTLATSEAPVLTAQP